MIFQYALFRPLVAAVKCVLYHYHLLPEAGQRFGNPLSTAMTIFSIVSLVAAMWALLQVYRLFAEVLKPNNIGSKFLVIKLYIWLHVLQGFIFEFIASKLEDDGKALMVVRIEYTVLCFEMLLASLLNIFVFKSSEFADSGRKDQFTLLDTNGKNFTLEEPLLG